MVCHLISSYAAQKMSCFSTQFKHQFWCRLMACFFNLKAQRKTSMEAVHSTPAQGIQQQTAAQALLKKPSNLRARRFEDQWVKLCVFVASSRGEERSHHIQNCSKQAEWSWKFYDCGRYLTLTPKYLDISNTLFSHPLSFWWAPKKGLRKQIFFYQFVSEAQAWEHGIEFFSKDTATLFTNDDLRVDDSIEAHGWWPASSFWAYKYRQVHVSKWEYS